MHPRKTVLCLALLLVTALRIWSAPAAPPTPPQAQASADFNAQTATNAWLATVPASDRAKSNAYFEGGYWLILWDFLYLAAVMILLLETGWSAKMRDNAERRTKVRWLQTFLYWTQFSIAITVLSFPLTVYEGFFREHQYGLSNQTFGSWFRDQAIGWAVGLLFGGLAVMALFAFVRRLERTWHIWGALTGIVFIIIGGMFAPVFIFPLFNTYTPLKQVRLKQQILSLARENGIPANDVYQVDASRQSKRVSANVSGLLGTERITLNDNLIARCSTEAVIAVMGHEMGHYVLHHIENFILFYSLVLLVMFNLLRWALGRLLAWRSQRWGIRAIGDLAVLPLAALVLSAIGFVFTPIQNTFTRTQEYEADIFGLNAARQPDGEAEVDLLLGEYRKLDPAPVEEFVFFDHPSGRTRIYAAMRWKAENLCLLKPELPCENPPKALSASSAGKPSSDGGVSLSH